MARKTAFTGTWLVGLSAMVSVAAWGAAEMPGTTSHSYWVQVASRAAGLAGSQWRTDIGINNPNPAQANLEIRFYPAGGGAPLTQTTFVPALAQSLRYQVSHTMHFSLSCRPQRGFRRSWAVPVAHGRLPGRRLCSPRDPDPAQQ